MKIVTVHPFDPWGEKIGGVETLIRLMVTHAPDDAQLSVIGVSEHESRPSGQWHSLNWQSRPVQFYGLFREHGPNQRKRVPLSLRFAWALRRFGGEFEEAVCIYHRPEPLWLSPIKPKKTVLAFHSDPRQWVSAASEVKWKHAPWLYRMVEARAVAKADALFTVNTDTLTTLQQRYSGKADCVRRVSTTYDNQVFYLSPGDERRRLRETLANEWGLNQDAKWALFAGRLEQQKDPLMALDAVSRLREISPDINCQLIVIGQGQLFEPMKQKAYELTISERVFFLGAQPQKAVADWMRASDVFLMTSSFEGLPIAMLESLACGLPVVASAAGDIGGIIQSSECGEFVIQQDADEYAKALVSVLNLDRETMSEYCVQAVRLFEPKSVIAEWLK